MKKNFEEVITLTKKQQKMVKHYAEKNGMTTSEAIVDSAIKYIETHEYPLFLEFFSKYHHDEDDDYDDEHHEGLHVDFSKIEE